MPVQRWLKLIPERVPWKVLAGLLSGGLLGACVMLLVLALLGPTANVPPPHRNDTPGDLTVRLSQGLLTSLAASNVQEVPLGLGTLPLTGVRAQPAPGDLLYLTGQVTPLGLPARTITITTQPCVANGRLALVVTNVDAGGLPATALTRQSVQNDVNKATDAIKLPVPKTHLAQVVTTTDAMILIYSLTGSGGQPGCPSV
jgi:hypothetical protein